MSSITGVKERIVLDIIDMLFGETARKFCECLCEYAPCSLRLVAEQSGIPRNDAKTVALAMYVHGVISIGANQLLTLNSLPVLVLSAPSLVFDHIEAVFERPKSVTEALRYVMLNGIVDTEQIRNGTADIDLSEPDAIDDMLASLDDLLKKDFLIRKVVDFSSFTTDDVRSAERRAKNLSICVRKTKSSNSDTSQDAPVSSTNTTYDPNAETLTVNWNTIAIFLRDRYVMQLGASVLGPSQARKLELVQRILDLYRGSDYSQHRNMMNKSDEDIRDRLLSYPRADVMALSARGSERLGRQDIFQELDDISGSPMNFIHSNLDGSSWIVHVPDAIRSLQDQYIQMFCEKSLSPYHRRSYNQVKVMGVADTHQIESMALLSEKDARSSLYDLAKLGFVQVQSIPRSSTDRVINPKSIFVWRYNETAAIEAYRTIIGEHARRLLSKIASLNDEIEKGERRDKLDSGNRAAQKMNEKREKFLVGFNTLYIEALRAFILFAEM